MGAQFTQIPGRQAKISGCIRCRYVFNFIFLFVHLKYPFVWDIVFSPRRYKSVPVLFVEKEDKENYYVNRSDWDSRQSDRKLETALAG